MAVYDRDIQTFQREIDSYEDKVKEAKDKYEEAKKQLENLNEEFEKNISGLAKDLIENFNEYAKSFFDKCELEMQYDKPKGSKIRLPVFRPKINNVIRKNLHQASKSEDIFLEYAFRMSLCEVFRNATRNKVNLMIESSEGPFDIGTIETLADIFVRFSNKNYLIVISNLGRRDFLESLVRKSKLENLSHRMVNFLEIGKLSKKQEDTLPKYTDLINDLISISSNQSKT